MYEAIEACDSCEPLQVGEQSYCRDCGLRLTVTAEASGRRVARWSWWRSGSR